MQASSPPAPVPARRDNGRRLRKIGAIGCLSLIVCAVLCAVLSYVDLGLDRVTLTAKKDSAACSGVGGTDTIAATTDPIYLYVNFAFFNKGRNVDVVWTAVDTIGGKNGEFAHKGISTVYAPNGCFDFDVSPWQAYGNDINVHKPWPTGRYKVDVYLNGNRNGAGEFTGGTPVKTVEFRVQ